MALWMVFVVASIVVGNLAGTHKAENSGNVGETASAEQMIKDGNFPKDPSVERILISSRSGPLDLVAAKAAAGDAAARLRALPAVTKVEDPVPSPDGKLLMIPVAMAGDPDTGADRVQPLLDATAAAQKDYPALRVEEVGNASIHKALDATVGKDFQRAELFSLPVTLLILLVAFGALIAAGAPVLLALSAVGAAIGLSSLTSYLVPAQDALSSVILLIGMAVGVDYSLFYRRRHLLVVRGGLDPRGGGVGTRVADRAAGAAGQAGSLGGPAADPVPVAADRGAGPGRRYRRPSALLVGGTAAGAEVPGGDSGDFGQCTGRPRHSGVRHDTEADRSAGRAAQYPGHAGVRPDDGGLPEHRYRARGRGQGTTGPGRLGQGGARRPERAYRHRPAVRPRPAAEGDGVAGRHGDAAGHRYPVRIRYRRREALAGPVADRPRTGDHRQGAGGPVRGNRRDRRYHGLFRTRQAEVAVGGRVRAAADVPCDGVDVPLGGGRGDRDRAEHALGRRRVRTARAGVPAHLGGEAAGLPVQPRRHLVAAAVPVRCAVRAVDGLPRLRGEPDPRGDPPGGTQPGSGRAGHHPLGRRGDECGGGDGRRLRHLRHAVHIGHETARCGARERDPHRRDHHPRGGTAVADDPAGQRQLVGAAVPAGAPDGGTQCGAGTRAGADPGGLRWAGRRGDSAAPCVFVRVKALSRSQRGVGGTRRAHGHRCGIPSLVTRHGRPTVAAEKYVYDFSEGNKEMKDLLGGKGANLAEMTNMGLPVPPGFTITTEACLRFLRDGGPPPEMLQEAGEHLARLEETMDKRLGDPEDPLLVSVRSGAKFSMPGMMDTVLNLGLNDNSVQGLAKQSDGDWRFAWDAYRRFIQMFGKIVMGIPGDAFEHELDAYKERKGPGSSDTDLDADDLQALVEDFKRIHREHVGGDFPTDPREQLRLAVEAVFRSWNGKRARDYRRQNKIPDDLGTAVNVVAMVFGNRGMDSGTGVAFTRDPATGEKVGYGDYLPNAQGEDVVAGIRNTLRLAELEELDKKSYDGLVTTMDTLEGHYRDMCDIEFTIEKGVLWILQTRVGKRTAFAEWIMAHDMLEEGLISSDEALLRVDANRLEELFKRVIAEKSKKDEKPVASGLNASPGAAVGRVVFTADDAQEWAERGEKVILVRRETTPDDYHGMIRSQGILTSAGGTNSHAAVVARGEGIPAVCGADAIRIERGASSFSVDGKRVQEGAWITI